MPSAPLATDSIDCSDARELLELALRGRLDHPRPHNKVGHGADSRAQLLPVRVSAHGPLIGRDGPSLNRGDLLSDARARGELPAGLRDWHGRARDAVCRCLSSMPVR